MLTPALRRRMQRSTAAERVRWAREQLNGGHVSQAEFAGLLGASRRQVIRLEKGRGNGDGCNADPAMRSRLTQATGLPEEFFKDEHTRR
jgi:transcriptional regulator with XRE-family HTH domain